MITELAILDVLPNREKEFEAAFASAEKLISRQKGYREHSLRNCIENPSRYMLLVAWDTLEDHTEGFRGSEDYAQWRALLHHFYDPFPEVAHYIELT